MPSKNATLPKRGKISAPKKTVAKKASKKNIPPKSSKSYDSELEKENIFEINEYESTSYHAAEDLDHDIVLLEFPKDAKKRKKSLQGEILVIKEDVDLEDSDLFIGYLPEELEDEEEQYSYGGEEIVTNIEQNEKENYSFTSYENNNAAEDVYISLKNAYVEGINTYNRAQGLKHFFLRKGKLLLTKIPILNNINLTCKAGEKIAFIGENGSGKSSLLKVVAGIYPIKSGIFDVKGRIAASIEMGFGMEYEMTGRQNIKLMMVYNNMLDLYTKELEDAIIEFSELGEKIDWPVKTYSSGMLSRLTFSVNLYQKPDILLLDEIFAAGDSHFVHKSLKVMKDKFLNTPISILVSHQEDLIKEVCNKVFYLKQGEIVAEGSPEEIYRQYNRENN